MKRTRLNYIFRLFYKSVIVIVLVCVDAMLFWDIIDTDPSVDPDVDLGGGYGVYEEFDRIDGPKFEVPSKIVNYSYDDRFIIVKQRLDEKPWSNYNDSCEHNYPYIHCTYYWIIDKTEDKRYGPLFYEQYQKKTDSLNVGLVFNKDNEKKIK